MAKKKKIDYQDIANSVAETDSDLDVSKGAAFELPPKGGVHLRFVEYVELGEQPRPDYQGKAKAPAEAVRLVFEIVNSKHVKEIEVNGEKVKFAHRISVPLTRILNEKSTYYKLFKQMRNDREDITMMAQMLGEGFLGTVVHNEGKNGKMYANLRTDDGIWTIRPPYRAIIEDDVETGEYRKVAIPEAIGDIRIFMWKRPTQETWDALFIDGDREVTDEKGKNTKVSKNFLQNTIKSAVNFEGSPIYELLGGLDSAIEDVEDYEDEEYDGEEEEVEYEDEEAEYDSDDSEDDSDESDDSDDDGEYEDEEEEESEDEEEELEEEEEEEEEEAPKPKKKALAKKAPAKKAPAKAAPKKSPVTPKKKGAVQTAAKSSRSAKTTASPVTKSPSKKKKKVMSEEEKSLRAMGLM